MKDTNFYQALFCCFQAYPDQSKRICTRCPLYANGLFVNDECLRILKDEIKRRKCEALRKDEEDE